MRRLTGRAHLILLANAALPDDPGTIVPVSFKVAHEIYREETEPKLQDLVRRLNGHVQVRGTPRALHITMRRVFFLMLMLLVLDDYVLHAFGMQVDSKADQRVIAAAAGIGFEAVLQNAPLPSQPFE